MIYHVAYLPIGKKDIRSRKPLMYSDTVNFIANKGWTLKAMAEDIIDLQTKCERIVVMVNNHLGYSMREDKIWEWRREED